MNAIWDLCVLLHTKEKNIRIYQSHPGRHFDFKQMLDVTQKKETIKIYVHVNVSYYYNPWYKKGKKNEKNQNNVDSS